MLFESFPALESLPFLCAGFTRRVSGLDVHVEREEALSRLGPIHREALAAAGLGGMAFASAEQVHGGRIAEVSSPTASPGADGLLTTIPGVCLGIYVADCAAVYLADRHGRGIALVHSGKTGTGLGIVSSAVEALCLAASAAPSDLVAQVSPCIRPPHYETDFAEEIVRQLASAGVRDIHDCGTCTASRPEDYYSYRREKGLTGRMLAFLASSAGTKQQPLSCRMPDEENAR
ncbi:MAG: polyphenol oxidase family protein [Verrucomicrobiae bacterium]